MGRRVEAPGALLEAERREDALCEAPLRVGVERPVQERRVDLRRGRATSSVSAGRRVANTSRTSVVVMPGS